MEPDEPNVPGEPDKPNVPGEPDKQQLLDEIRRRAEEAELQRLDEEEKGRRKATGEVPPGSVKAPEPARFPAPSREPGLPPARPSDLQRVLVLRERLNIALDRGHVERVADLIAELAALAPDDPEIPKFKARLAALDESKTRVKEKKPQTEARRRDDSTDERVEREARRKKLAELFESANSFYQQEKYEKGLQVIEQLLEIDPNNSEAGTLRDQIDRARKLAEQVKIEEAKRKAAEAVLEADVVTPEFQPQTRETKDIWGTGRMDHGDVGYELVPEQKGPVAPPKPPLVERLVEKASRVRIPVKPLVTAGVIIVVAAVAYFIIDSIRNAVVPPRYSLLVLPATTVAADTDLVYLADGLSEDLMRDLSGVSELRVIAPTTAFTLRSSSVAPLQLARGYVANYCLQWSVLRTPDGLILQPNLFDTTSSSIAWTGRFTTSLRELPALRQELARKVASAMQATLTEEEDVALRRIPTANQYAYDAYLRGRSAMRQPERYPASLAIQSFELALQADSQFTDAQSALGWAYIRGYETSADQPQIYLTRASACIQRAVSLGSRGSETFRVWGMVEQFRSQYEKSLEWLEQSVAVSPSDAESQRRLAALSVVKGRGEAALIAARRAVSDDPGNLESYTVLGLVQQFGGDYRGALSSYEQGLRLAPDKSVYGSGLYADVLVYLQQHERAVRILMDRLARVRDSYIDFYKLGRIEQSAGKPKQEWYDDFQRAKTLIEAKLAAQPNDPVTLSQLALVQTRLGSFRDAGASNSRARRLAPSDLDVLYNTARMYAMQGDKGQALEFLSKAVARRFVLERVMDMDLFNLHAEPGFLRAITQ